MSMMRGGRLTSKGMHVAAVIGIAGLIIVAAGFYLILPAPTRSVTSSVFVVGTNGVKVYGTPQTFAVLQNPVDIFDSPSPSTAGQVGIQVAIASTVTAGTPVSWVISGYTTETMFGNVIKNETFYQAGAGVPSPIQISPSVIGGAVIGLSNAITRIPHQALIHAPPFNGGIVFSLQGQETVTFADGSTQTQTFSYPSLVSLNIVPSDINGVANAYTLGVQ